MEPASDNPPAPTSRLGQLVRTLRNLTALGFLTLSVGVLALWARSYVMRDSVYGNWARAHWSFSSRCGRLNLVGGRPGGQNAYYLLRSRSEPAGKWRDKFRESGFPPKEFGGFGYYELLNAVWVFIPLWFVALVFAALALALKPKPRLRFSLSDLLVLMTFSAVLIAGAAGLTRFASLPVREHATPEQSPTVSDFFKARALDPHALFTKSCRDTMT
jgi:hypothetical protein